MTVRIGIGAFGVAALVLWTTGALAADTNYGYDVHGQLVSVGRTAGSATYAYDKAGNRTQLTASAGSAQSASAAQTSAKNTDTTLSVEASSEATAFVLPQSLPENDPATSSSAQTADH